MFKEEKDPPLHHTFVISSEPSAQLNPNLVSCLHSPCRVQFSHKFCFQFSQNSSSLISDHPRYLIKFLISHPRYLIAQVCLQQEFIQVPSARIPFAMMFPLSDFPATDPPALRL